MDAGAPRSPLVRALMVSASLVIVIAGLRAASGILAPVAFAVLLSVGVAPLLRWLQQKGVPGQLAVLLVILGLVAAGLLLIGSLSLSLRQLGRELPTYHRNLARQQAALAEWLAARGLSLPMLLGPLGSDTQYLVRIGGVLVRALVSILNDALLILLVAVFFTLDAPGLAARLAAHWGAASVLRDRFAAYSRRSQAYLRISTLNSLLLGTALGVWLAATGVDFALLWGILAFLLSYIPGVGLLLASIPPILLAFIQYGLGRALLVAGGMGAIVLVADYIIRPRILGQGVNLSAVTTIVALLFWGWLWGPLGALLAVPLTVALRLALDTYPETRWLAIAMSAGRENGEGSSSE